MIFETSIKGLYIDSNKTHGLMRPRWGRKCSVRSAINM